MTGERTADEVRAEIHAAYEAADLNERIGTVRKSTYQINNARIFRERAARLEAELAQMEPSDDRA